MAGEALAKYRDSQKAKKEGEKEQDRLYTYDPDKTYIFELCKPTGIARNVLVSNKCMIRHDGKLKEIRYIPTEESIFVEDQQAYDERHYPLEPIVFHRDKLRFSGDKMLYEFLMAHDGNEDNPNRVSRKEPVFKLANKDIVLKKEAEEQELQFKAEQLIRESSIDDIKVVAKVVFGIKSEDDQEVKNRLIKLSRNQPILVTQNMGNPQVKRKYDFLTALDKGIIETNTKHNVAVWNDTKVEITTLKPTEAPEDTLVKYSFSKDGEEVYKILKTKLT